MIIIDSDILIWILRNKQEIVNHYKTTVELFQGQLYITPIQYAEIISGVKEHELIQTEIFLDSVGMIDITKEIANTAGKYRQKYSKTHHLYLADTITAATVKQKGYRLWTLNIKHYPMLNKNDFYQIN